MQQSPSWEADRFSASQEIPLILCKPKAHCRIYRCLPPVSVLCHINAVHAPIPFTEDLSEYYPPIYSWVSQVISFPQVSPSNLCSTCHLPHTCFMPCLPLIDLIYRIIIDEYTSLSCSLCSFLPSLVASPSNAQISSSTPSSQTPSAYVPPWMWATKLHTHTK
jgi:hypothetical protein